MTVFMYRTGTYEIDGQTYLEGTKHQDKLKEGAKCEIFIEVTNFSTFSKYHFYKLVRNETLSTS